MFKHFSVKKFEYELYNLKNKGYIEYYSTATDEMMKLAGKYIAEEVYYIITKNPFVKIVVYSTLDRRSGTTNDNKMKTREKGKDAVRILLLWRMKDKLYIKSFKNLYRVDTFFDNLEKTIKEINLAIERGLDLKEFKPLK